MKEKLKQLLLEGQEKIQAARSESELQEVKGLLLGKQGGPGLFTEPAVHLQGIARPVQGLLQPPHLLSGGAVP